uniref:Uncharacterized protein n=1 Tax=Anguilla anguilla TaxID=7936 RepID=A0A0E9W6L8_ANGAN
MVLYSCVDWDIQRRCPTFSRSASWVTQNSNLIRKGMRDPFS